MPDFSRPPPDAGSPVVFPSTRRLALLLALYEVLWHLMLPAALIFLCWRGRKEPLYRQFWGERLGLTDVVVPHPVWLHGASLGELRGLAPLVQALLERGWPLLVTTLTPAGRSAAHTLFAPAIAARQMQVAYVPFDIGWAVRALLRRARPRCVLMSESEAWPALLAAVRRAGVPLATVNAQYTARSFERDRRGLFGFRAALFAAYELVLCKSAIHAGRFRAVGCPWVEVGGETRFDLPLPPGQLHAAARLAAATAGPQQRLAICFASAVAGEDAPFIEALGLLRQRLEARGMPVPLCIVVPRSPQHFDTAAARWQGAGWRVLRRSQALDASLTPQPGVRLDQADVLLGDSLGEMAFYLSLSAAVVVGGSFVDLGAHNVIEPLALKKPVFVGPSIWGIEYPAVEALAAGVLRQTDNAAALADALSALLSDAAALARAADGAAAFFAEHGGATARHMAVLERWIPR